MECYIFCFSTFRKTEIPIKIAYLVVSFVEMCDNKADNKFIQRKRRL